MPLAAGLLMGVGMHDPKLSRRSTHPPQLAVVAERCGSLVLRIFSNDWRRGCKSDSGRRI